MTTKTDHLVLSHMKGVLAELFDRKSVLERVLDLDFLDDQTIEANRMDLDSVNESIDNILDGGSF